MISAISTCSPLDRGGADRVVDDHGVHLVCVQGLECLVDQVERPDLLRVELLLRVVRAGGAQLCPSVVPDRSSTDWMSESEFTTSAWLA